MSRPLPGGVWPLLRLLAPSYFVNERALRIITKFWKKAKFPLMINHLALSSTEEGL